MKSAMKYISDIQGIVIEELITNLRKQCLLTADVEETIKQCVSIKSSFFSDSSTPKKLDESSCATFGNQGHGKFVEKQIALQKYSVDINKYSHTSKYDISEKDNTITNKNVSIKTTSSNTICCGDAYNFYKSNNCEMIVVSYKQDTNQTKVIHSMYSIVIDDVLRKIDNTSIILNDLNAFSLYVKEKKKYFQSNLFQIGEFEDFRSICKQKSKELSNEFVRINTKISKPKPNIKKFGEYICENFRIQCSLNLKNLIKCKLVSDISNELSKYNISTEIISSRRTLKKQM